MNANDHAYKIVRGKGELKELNTECQHEFGTYQDDKKWGVVTWYVCVHCDGVTRERMDTSVATERRQRKINYQTEHAGHPRGAKIEHGNSSPLGKDYERN